MSLTCTMRTSVLQTDKQAKFTLTGILVDVSKSKQDLQELLENH